MTQYDIYWYTDHETIIMTYDGIEEVIYQLDLTEEEIQELKEYGILERYGENWKVWEQR